MKSIAVALLSIALAACQSSPPVKEEPKARPIGLIESYAKSAADSLRSLAEIETVSRKEKAQKQAEINNKIAGSDELYQRLDFAYNGHLDVAIEALLKNASGMSSWKLSLPDTKPLAPVLVSVYGRDKTVFEYLENMGAQVGARAIISVDPAEKTIHIVYGVREIR